MSFLFNNMILNSSFLGKSYLEKNITSNGLWLQNKCDKCSVKMWYKFGYGKFNAFYDLTGFLCQKCGNVLSPVRCCFNYCKYLIKGKRTNAEGVYRHMCQCSHKYEITSKFCCEWDHLEITTEPADYFQIFCKSLNGKTYTLNVTPKTTIDEIHETICKKMGFDNIKESRDIIYLVCTHPLLFGKTLSDYGISAESTLHAIGRLR